MTRIIAHRGCSKLYPENSLIAFIKALEQGADALEVDLRCSTDGVIYCFHDANLNRLTNCKGLIEQSNSAYLDKLLIRAKEPLLRFTDFLSEFAGKTGIILDIKSNNIENKIIESVENTSYQKSFVYSSFSADILEKIKKINPSSETALIVGPVRNLGVKMSKYLISRLNNLDCSAVHLSYHITSLRLINNLKEAGFRVAVWTINDKQHQEKYTKAGVDGLISDVPEVLIENLQPA